MLKSITFQLDQTELDYIETMATEIHECPVRNRGRSFEQVYQSTKSGCILEFALERLGASKNNLPFDVANRESYAWDVLLDGKKTEVKRKRFLHNDSTKYFSWDNPSYVKTFLRNLDLVEQLVVGDYKEIDENRYSVEWMLKTDIDENFYQYVKKSMYNVGQMYYNHTYDPKCQYLMGV